MSTRVTVVASGAHHELVVDYDGRQPPLELFEVWAGLGWQAPTPATPPRDAIDWDTPDPVTSKPYSLRSWAATGVASLPRHPGDDRRRMADALEAARRLGCEVDGAINSPPPPTSLPPSFLPAVPASQGNVRITAVLLSHAAPSLIAGARSRGATVHAHETSISRTVRYRGSTTVTQTPAVEVEIAVDEREVEAIVSALTPHATSAPEVEREG
jgi:hypothetical protein